MNRIRPLTFARGCMLALLSLGFALPAQANVKTPASWCLKKQPKTVKGSKLWHNVLKRHAYKGRLDYNGIRRHSQPWLRGYICQLANTKVKGWPRAARFAFWVNAYNATAVRAVLDRLPNNTTGQKLFSTMTVKKFWKRKYKVGQQWLSLDAIENKILRPRFKDARIHFALASASAGGPALAPWPYAPKQMNKQLDWSSRLYFRSSRALKIDKSKKEVWLSKIFKWYKKDFAKKGKNSELAFVAKYAPKAHAAWLKKNWKGAKIKYLAFSWKLNAIKAPAHLLLSKSDAKYVSLLKKFAKRGWINYNGIREKGKPWLKAYIDSLRKAKLTDLDGRKAKMAFWLNAYNALVIHSVLQDLPNSTTGQKLFSVMTVRNFWKKKHSVAGLEYSLNDIQHKILRKRFRDPRTHFALTSAAQGGASVAARPYRADRLNWQLNRGTRWYLQSPRALKIDKNKKEVWLSKIFKWYKKDFAKKGKNSELAFVAKYAPKAHAAWLKKNWKGAKIKYLAYSWKLNLQGSWIRKYNEKGAAPAAPAKRAAAPAKRAAAKRAAPPARRKAASANPHAIFGKLLRKFVRKGRVNYSGIRRSGMPWLNGYLKWLAETNIKDIKGRRARMAFWSNAYNAVTIKAVLDRAPRSRGGQRGFSVVKAKGFWKKKYTVAKRRISLNAIENKILRPRYKDARIHFALVCASHGCPDLLSQEFNTRNFYWLMSFNTRRYLKSPRALKIDKSKKQVWLSKIFKWYRKDFAKKGKNSELVFVAKYAPKAHAAWLKKNWKGVKIKYLPYSWKLNVQ